MNALSVLTGDIHNPWKDHTTVFRSHSTGTVQGTAIQEKQQPALAGMTLLNIIKLFSDFP